MLFLYCKHWRISRTFLLKIFVSNQGCGLSARTSEDHAINLHKLTLFSKNFTISIDLCSKMIRTPQDYTTVRLLLRVWWLLWLKEPFLFILTGLTLPFLSSWMSLGRESLSTRKLFTLPPMAAHFDRNQSLNERAKIRVVNCIVPSTPNFWSIAWLLSYERTNRNRSIHVVVCKFYWETVDIMKNNGLKIPEKDQIYV